MREHARLSLCDGYAKVRAMPRVDGGTLRAWRRSRGWDVPEMARRLRRTAGGDPMPAHDSLVRQIRGWERGDHQLSERHELLYARALGISPGELAHGPPQSLAVITSADASLAIAGVGPRAAHDGVIPDWPAWFGLKLAHLITLTDTWHPSSQLGSLQALLDQEISMSDAVVPRDEHPLDVLHAVSRRQALLTLGSLPMATTGAWPTGGVSRVTADDAFLARCAASLTACWHLLRGSDLATVEQLLAGYLLPLEAAARQDSRHRQVAAMLTAQAHRICGIISLHRNQLRVREQHCKRALHFAELACDASSHASALISLASTYFYAADPEAAAAVYEQAFSHGHALPKLQRSRVHAELAVVYGQLGREHDSIRAAGQAEELYPDRPEEDPSFLYAEFTPASLTLERGLAYVALAERFPGRGYQQKAAGIFGGAMQPGPAVPDRIRFEIINHQASTAVLLGELDAFEAFLGQGLDGAALLGSRQRLREMQTTWHRAMARWPAEERVKALGEGLRRAVSAEDRA